MHSPAPPFFRRASIGSGSTLRPCTLHLLRTRHCFVLIFPPHFSAGPPVSARLCPALPISRSERPHLGVARPRDCAHCHGAAPSPGAGDGRPQFQQGLSRQGVPLRVRARASLFLFLLVLLLPGLESLFEVACK
jgi:hypothetical protein